MISVLNCEIQDSESDFGVLFLCLFRKVRTDPGSELTIESTEKKEEKGRKCALPRISRKIQKNAKEIFKIKKCSRDRFSLLFALRSVFLCAFSVSSVVKRVRISRMNPIFFSLLVNFAFFRVFRVFRVSFPGLSVSSAVNLRVRSSRLALLF